MVMICLAVLALAFASEAVIDDESASCFTKEFVAEESTAEGCILLQKSQEKSQRSAYFPDFTDQLKQAAGIMQNLPGTDGLNDMVAKVMGVVDGVAETSLTTLGETINETLIALAMKADGFEAFVNESNDIVADGIASSFARAAGLSVDTLPQSHEFEELTVATLTQALALWDAFETSSQSATTVVTKVMATIGLVDAANGFNASVQTALKEATQIRAPVRRAQGLLANSSSLTPAAAREIAEELMKEIQVATKELEAFPQIVHTAFQMLDDRVAELANWKLGVDTAARVHLMLRGVEAQADVTTMKITRPTLQLLYSVDRGTEVASQRMQAAAFMAPSSLLLYLALPMCLYQASHV